MKKRALTILLMVVGTAVFGALNNNTKTEDGRTVIEPGAISVDGHRLATTTQVAVVQSNLDVEVSRATNAEHLIQVQVDAVKARTSAWDGAVTTVDSKVAKTGQTGEVNLTSADVRVAAPTISNQAATKLYVDTYVVESATNVSRWSEYAALQDVDMGGFGHDDVGHVEFDDGERIDGAFVKDSNDLRLGGINALRLNKPAISGYLGAGRVVAWGDNSEGQCNVPEDASNSVVAINVGSDRHSLALRSDGRVVAWGYNASGQSTVPADASNSVIAVAGGGEYSLALRSDGRVVAWGKNDQDQCNVPADASNSVVAVSGGYSHSLAIRGIQELPEIKTPAIWLPVNGVIYFGTTTNYLRDMNGTNFLFKAGAAEKLMLP